MTTPIVLGIHGLRNKPPCNVLADWWQTALGEGLRRNHDAGLPPSSFDLAYWADVRNPNPVAERDQAEPYVPAAGSGPRPRFDTDFGDTARAFAQKWGGRMIDKGKDLIGIGPGVEKLLAVKLDDLGDYYAHDDIRAAIRERLRSLLDAHRARPILLIAHSMGSIIAHDVLRADEAAGTYRVEHLVTIGSPLGLPLVSHSIREEFGTLRTPANVGRWRNLSDPGDKVALDCNLRDEFKANDAGARVEDVLIHNDYVGPGGEPNQHKSYGYLRAPELSDIVKGFVLGGASGADPAAPVAAKKDA